MNELVGRINGQFGSVEFVPIHYMHQSVDFTELVALYNVSDVCLVSSTRDGMNLVLILQRYLTRYLMSTSVRNKNVMES